MWRILFRFVSYLVAPVAPVKHADEDGDDAVAAHEFAVVGRGGHGLEGDGHPLHVAAAQHRHQRVHALDLGVDGLLAVAGGGGGEALGRHRVDGGGETHHRSRVVVLEANWDNISHSREDNAICLSGIRPNNATDLDFPCCSQGLRFSACSCITAVNCQIGQCYRAGRPIYRKVLKIMFWEVPRLIG